MALFAPVLDRLLPAPRIDPDIAAIVGALDRPNFCLAAPASSRLPHIHILVEALDMPPDAAAQRLARYLDAGSAAGRITVQHTSADGQAIDFVERTAGFRFPDLVNVRLAASPETVDGTDVTILSRSVYGYSDLGANRKRVRRLLRHLAGY